MTRCFVALVVLGACRPELRLADYEHPTLLLDGFLIDNEWFAQLETSTPSSRCGPAAATLELSIGGQKLTRSDEGHPHDAECVGPTFTLPGELMTKRNITVELSDGDDRGGAELESLGWGRSSTLSPTADGGTAKLALAWQRRPPFISIAPPEKRVPFVAGQSVLFRIDPPPPGECVTGPINARGWAPEPGSGVAFDAYPAYDRDAGTLSFSLDAPPGDYVVVVQTNNEPCVRSVSGRLEAVLPRVDALSFYTVVTLR